MKTWKHAATLLVLTAGGIAAAATAVGPICDTGARVNSTTYYSCSGSIHEALDMSNGTCGSYIHRAMLVGTWYYGYSGGCGSACYGNGCNNGAGNYYVHNGYDGWNFRQLHVNETTASGSKTCDRCNLGLLGGTGTVTGPHVHADNRVYTTRKTAWYTSAGTTCGTSANCSNTVGYPQFRN